MPSLRERRTHPTSLFSIGNLTALYQAAWPTCWKTYTDCDQNWVAAVTYLQIIGIIVGQITVGFEGDWIGRRFGLVQDALVMTRESARAKRSERVCVLSPAPSERSSSARVVRRDAHQAVGLLMLTASWGTVRRPRPSTSSVINGLDAKRLGHLLRLQSVLLRYWRWRRVPHDVHHRHGEQDHHQFTDGR